MAGKHKPKALKARTGTLRSNLPQGIEVPAGVPDRPHWLSPEAAEIWDRLAPITAELDLLSKNDQIPYALLCDAVAVFIDLRQKFDDLDSAVHYSAKGGSYQSPFWSMLTRQRDFILRIGREFGMTPSARSGINVGGDGPDDDPLDVLNARFGELMKQGAN